MEIENVSWQGYLRKNGKLGVRNKILVIYTVKCSEFVASQIVQRSNSAEVEYVGFDGCTDNQYAINILLSLIKHPNIGAVIAVGLGCEYIQPEWLAKVAAEEGKLTEWLFIQEVGGTQKSIELGLLHVNRMKEVLRATPRREMYFKDLIIGAECGGSDFTSGLAGNVVVGKLFDMLVDAGGTAVFEEIVEAIGLDKLLRDRAANEEAEREIQFTYEKALDYCKAVRQYSVSPGNFAGGLSTIEEKSMGAIIKSGSKPIQGVVKVACTPKHNGLWLLDTTPDPHWMQFGITNPNDNEGLMDLISAGAHIVFLVTGRGNVVGSAVSPCIKITGNHDTYVKMEEDMDFDASLVLRGECSLEKLAIQLAQLVIHIAGGSMSKSESMGHQEYFIPYKFQEKEVTFKRPCDVG